MKNNFIILLAVMLIQLSVYADEVQTGTDGEVSDSDIVPAETPEPVKAPEPVAVEEFFPEMFLPETGLIDINRELNTKLRLFPESPVFLNARLYKGTIGNYKVVILSSDSTGHLIETPIIMDDKTITNIRTSLVTGIAKSEKNAVEEKKREKQIENKNAALLKNDMGVMAELLSVSIIYSGGWGAMMPFIFGGEDAEAKAYLSSSLIGAGAGFFVPFLALRKSDLSTGGAIAAELGGLRGTLDGFLISSLCAGLDGHTKVRGMVGMMAAMSMTEYFGGMYVAEKMKISEERMRAITAYSFLGYITSGELFVLIAGIGSENRMDVSAQDGLRIFSGFMLAGGVGGMISGYYLSKKTHYTSGDTVILGTTASVIGGFPLALASLGDDVDARIYSGVALASTVGGIVAGHYFAKNFDFKAWQAVMVDLSTIGGALVGFGLAWLIADDDMFSSVGTITVPIAVGGAVGFAALMAVFAKDARNQRVERENSFLSNFRVNLNPYAFTAINREMKISDSIRKDPVLLEDHLINNPSNTMLNIQYSW